MDELETRILQLLATADGRIRDEAQLEDLREQICSRHGGLCSFADQQVDKFVQLNFLGPAGEAELRHAEPDDPELRRLALRQLQLDGEEPFARARAPHCLLLANFVVDSLLSSQSADWCLRSARVTFLHHSLLADRSPTLHSRILQLLRLDESSPELLSERPLSEQLEHWALLAQLCLLYFEAEASRQLLARCQRRLRLRVELDGASGVRTKFQQDSKAQLYLRVVREPIGDGEGDKDDKEDKEDVDDEDDDDDDEEAAAALPKDVALEDDTLLPCVQFDESMPTPRLSALQQAVVLLAADLHRATRASDTIVEEELLAYHQRLLSAPRSWCVATSALAKRSRLESQAPRRLERALKQLEELGAQAARPLPAFAARRRLFFAACPPTVWRLQVQLADLLLDTGAVSSALELYERWDQYSQLIGCYQRLEKASLAERLIRQRLAAAPSADLYCALAEVTRDWSHLHTAWRVSGRRSARAQRSLGYVAMVAGRHAEAIGHFELSLGANHLQPRTWFTHGCCCMQAGEFAKAETAFRRSSQLEPDNCEAWTNLGTALARQGKKAAARAVLAEALRHAWHNWRVWDNYLAVCCDTGFFDEAVRAYHQLLELRPKYWDPHSAAALVTVVVDQLPDAGNDADCHERLRQQLRQLFGRLAAQSGQSAQDPELWWQYARLLRSADRLDADTKAKVLQLLLRCHRCDLQRRQQQHSWEDSPQLCESVLQRAAEVASCCVDWATDCPGGLLSARLLLNSLLARLPRLPFAVGRDTVQLLRQLLSTVDQLQQQQQQQSAADCS